MQPSRSRRASRIRRRCLRAPRRPRSGRREPFAQAQCRRRYAPVRTRRRSRKLAFNRYVSIRPWLPRVVLRVPFSFLCVATVSCPHRCSPSPHCSSPRPCGRPLDAADSGGAGARSHVRPRSARSAAAEARRIRRRAGASSSSSRRACGQHIGSASPAVNSMRRSRGSWRGSTDLYVNGQPTTSTCSPARSSLSQVIDRAEAAQALSAGRGARPGRSHFERRCRRGSAS